MRKDKKTKNSLLEKSLMNILRTCFFITLLPLLAPSVALSDNDGDGNDRKHDRHSRAPLVELIRKATERYRDVNVAMAEGYVQGTPCVSGRTGGAMGIHFVNPAILFIDGDPKKGLSSDLDASQPEALMYEPQRKGTLRLVGVEYIAAAQEGLALNGHLLNLTGSPNRYGLPAFSELHVWAWRDNPNGTFTDQNPRVSCDAQALDGE
jgi:hypothetical protein